MCDIIFENGGPGLLITMCMPQISSSIVRRKRGGNDLYTTWIEENQLGGGSKARGQGSEQVPAFHRVSDLGIDTN